MQDGCTSFSLGKSEDCFLFGHEKILPVKSLGGECYRIVKTAGELTINDPEWQMIQDKVKTYIYKFEKSPKDGPFHHKKDTLHFAFCIHLYLYRRYKL